MSANNNAALQPSARKSPWITMAVDFGPLLVFFAAYRYFAPSGGHGVGEVTATIFGTAAFMAASLVALVVSKWKLGRISPMLWLTTAMIVGFGAITIYTQNPEWIRHKPTAVYVLFAAILTGGLMRGQALLKILLATAFEGLNDRGWWILSRNWAVFFVFLAGLNEGLNLKHGGIYYVTMETWIAAKLWLFMPLSFLFTFVHIPMLMRHGLAAGEQDDVVVHPPHE